MNRTVIIFMVLEVPGSGADGSRIIDSMEYSAF